MIFNQRLLPAIAVTLAALSIVQCLWAAKASAAGRVVAQTPTGVGASARVAPFRMYFSGTTMPQAPTELRLNRIVILGARSGERVVFLCIHCRGADKWSTTARGRTVVLSLSHVIITARSRLIVDITKPGSIGRYKEYTLRPRLLSRRLIQQGCLAIDVYERINCSASGKVDLQVGPGAVIPTTPPSCPGNPCQVLGRMTGFQVSLAGQVPVSTVSMGGYIVAWRIALGSPSPEQISFLDAAEGGPAEAGIGILRVRVDPRYELIAQSPLVKLQAYFGTTAQFRLEPPLRVEPGDVIALTAPTWAPAIAANQGSGALWRASRQSSQCSIASNEQASDMQIGTPIEYACLYGTDALTYSATLDPSV